ETTGAIAFDASALDVRSARRAVHGTGDGDWRVDKAEGSGRWVINASGIMRGEDVSGIPLACQLTGGGAPASVAIVQRAPGRDARHIRAQERGKQAVWLGPQDATEKHP